MPPKRSTQAEKRNMTIQEMLEETQAWREWYREEANRKGHRSSIEAAACAIREQALEDAMLARKAKEGS